ncbi:MAG: hypothetical protein MJE77_13830 [Proteobacteria bacterium]|nr:hypothetical protein [Pseudomonadota bacterium]
MSQHAQMMVWERAKRGQHVVALGFSWLEAPSSLHLVRISCDVPDTTLGPLFDAQHKIERILDSEATPLFQARDWVMSGLRRRFLGDVPARGPDAALVEACNRLAHHGQPRALVFDAADAADQATCQYLQRILERPGWLELPLILVVRDREPSSAAAQLIDTVRRIHGEDAIVAADEDETPVEAEVETESGPETAADRAAAPSTIAGPADQANRPARADPATGHGQDRKVEILDLAALPSDVLRVLRAGAVIGSGFEIVLVAELLDCSPFDALYCLQRARDIGVPVSDRGEARFFLPQSLIKRLRSSLLPSLTTAWHRRLAAILTARSDADPAIDSQVHSLRPPVDRGVTRPVARINTPDRPAKPSAGSPPRSAGLRDQPAVDNRPALTPSPGALAQARLAVELEGEKEAGDRYRRAAARGAPSVGGKPYAELFDASQARTNPDNAPGLADELAARHAVTRARPAASQAGHRPAPIGRARRSEAASSPVSARSTPTGPAAGSSVPGRPAARTHGGKDHVDPGDVGPGDVRPDDVRAARHLSAAGEVEAAAERYAQAAAEAASLGAYGQAISHGQKALQLIESLPASPNRRLFRIQLMAALGRLQWQAASSHGDRPDPAFTLKSALRTAESVHSSLSDDDPPELIAESSILIAGICYDLGDLRSLERALDELTQTSRLLLDAGDATGAARMLNDQAAVYVRLGDPVRASHLLSQSQALFEEKADDDPVAVEELAETHHLLSRLPLHARIRPGREDDAFSMAMDHALIAEDNYRDLGNVREIGRVWETMGRLEFSRDRLDRADQRLAAALQLQSRIGDITGLARSSAARSDVLAQAGRTSEALELLGDSIALNRTKGSPLGLAFNRQAFDRLVATLERDESADPDIADRLATTAGQLESAEATIGRVVLPELPDKPPADQPRPDLD